MRLNAHLMNIIVSFSLSQRIKGEYQKSSHTITQTCMHLLVQGSDVVFIKSRW